MRRTFAVAIISIALAAAAHAQDVSRQALAEELLNQMNMRDSIEKSFAMVKRMVPAQMEQMQRTSGQTNSSASYTNQMNAVMDLMSKELSWDNLKGDYIALYAETFSVDELQGLLAFYKSPTGAAFLKKQPELMQRSMELSQRMMRQVLPKLQALSKPAQAAPATTSPALAPRSDAQTE